MRPPVNHYRDEWRRAADGVYTACSRDNNGDEISFGVDPTLLGTAARPTRHAMTGTIDPTTADTAGLYAADVTP